MSKCPICGNKLKKEEVTELITAYNCVKCEIIFGYNNKEKKVTSRQIYLKEDL